MLQLCGTSTTASSSADTSVGPASVMVGNLVQGNRLAAAQGRDLGFTDDNKVRKLNLAFTVDLKLFAFSINLLQGSFVGVQTRRQITCFIHFSIQKVPLRKP